MRGGWLLAGVILVSAAAPARAADDAAIAAAIDGAAQQAIAAGETPGLQVAVYKDGKPLLVKGYGAGSLELAMPVGNDSIFRIGSVTKQFTAAALVKLEEEGKLSLDDLLSKYYPDYPRAGEITLKQMLHHTSGMHNYTEDESFLAQAALTKSPDQWVAYFAKMPKVQDFEPGTDWNYSNTAYFLLGAVVEKVEGRPLAKVLEARFFEPLGLRHTALDDEREIVAGRVAGYDGEPGKFRNAAPISMTIPGGAGAMRSTAEDLARWNAALFGGKVLKPASLAAMTAPGKLGNGRTSSEAIAKKGGMPAGEYGYALFISDYEGHRKISHGGGIFGFNSSLSEFPGDRVTVAVIANSIGKDLGARMVAERIERIALDLPAKPVTK
ncbi:MAG: beta-lactamase family protein [Proteobacteria bacterium]|nr:beta-lactamase family protein [Pseudomonadota bacterium]